MLIANHTNIIIHFQQYPHNSVKITILIILVIINVIEKNSSFLFFVLGTLEYIYLSRNVGQITVFCIEIVLLCEVVLSI